MQKKFSDYLNDFDEKFSDLDIIDADFHRNTIGVESKASKRGRFDKDGKFTEEYIRTRFVYAMVYSGFFPKELILIEHEIPKGNGGKSLKSDIVVFKDVSWRDSLKNNRFDELRQNYLVFFESKKGKNDVVKTIDLQLRPVMSENESNERVFGIYFDNQPDIILLKKIGNSPVRRFNESLEFSQGGMQELNLIQRDLLIDLPNFNDFKQNNQSISDVTKLILSALDAVDESAFEDFLAELKRIADSKKPKHNEKDLIVEFLTLKVFDEKRSQKEKTNLQFYIEPKEKKADGLGEKSFRVRMKQLYKDAKSEYANILTNPYFSYDSTMKPSSSNDERFLIALVESFQKRAILKAKNESFNQIIFNNFGNEQQKADKGQFFTPIPLVKAIIQMLNPIKNEELCDPCCGICDFLAMAFKYSHAQNESYASNASHYYGFDIESSNLKLAELNLVLNGDGGAILKNINSISQKLLENGQILNDGDFNNSMYNSDDWSALHDPDKELKKFKIIATNPPFGKGRDLRTGKDSKWDVPKNTIELYETYKKKSKPNSKGKIELPKSIDTGVIFLENAYKLLEFGGRMAIVLSNSIASITEWQNIREWFMERMRIVALIDLPANSFGETGVATTVIIAYKPKGENEKKELIDNSDYSIFVKEIEKIGYEVKTIKRTITFKPQFLINEDTFENTGKLDEEFTDMVQDFKQYLKSQEQPIKVAFNADGF